MSSSGEAVRIGSAHARGEVRVAGAILRAAELRVGDRWVVPFADAPWAGDPATAGHMRWLGGEFFCLPFGGTAQPTAPGGWACRESVDPLHGPAANAAWQFTDVAADRVALALDYPPDGDVERVERTISCAADAARFDIEVVVHARRTTRAAAAFHPILRLPDRPGALHLAADFAAGRTYPVALDGVLRADAAFADLGAVPGASATVDLSRLPLAHADEEHVQLLRVVGPITATYADDGFRLVLDWDRTRLPHALIWLHDRAKAMPPWRSSFRGVGVEPCATAFGLSASLQQGRNPLSDAGETTALELAPGEPVTLRMSIAAEPA